jgi:hypothetical protein
MPGNQADCCFGTGSSGASELVQLCKDLRSEGKRFPLLPTTKVVRRLPNVPLDVPILRNESRRKLF